MDKALLEAICNLLCHLIERDAVCARDVAFLGIIFPRAKDEDTPSGDAVKYTIGRLVIIAEAVISKDDITK